MAGNSLNSKAQADYFAMWGSFMAFLENADWMAERAYRDRMIYLGYQIKGKGVKMGKGESLSPGPNKWLVGGVSSANNISKQLQMANIYMSKQQPL